MLAIFLQPLNIQSFVQPNHLSSPIIYPAQSNSINFVFPVPF